MFGCELGTIDFAAYARAVGAQGFRCATPEEVGPAIAAALRAPGPAVIGAIVKVNAEVLRPELMKG